MRALVKAGSDYMKIKEDDLKNQIKALRQIAACQPDKSKTMKIFNRQYNPFGGSVNEEISTDLYYLFSLTFEEMHEAAKINNLKE